jgi:hypothetical protein
LAVDLMQTEQNILNPRYSSCPFGVVSSSFFSKTRQFRPILVTINIPTLDILY